MIHNLKFILFIVLTSLFLGNGCALKNIKNEVFAYEPEVVRLEGIINIRKGFGPPNFGETPHIDKKDQWYVLLLKNPINVNAKTGDELNSSEKNIQEIQIVPSKYNLKELVRKKVTIQGSLFHAHTAHHRTQVLVTIKDISNHQKAP